MINTICTFENNLEEEKEVGRVICYLLAKEHVINDIPNLEIKL